MLTVTYAECRCAKRHYAECHYAECHYAERHYTECRASLMFATLKGRLLILSTNIRLG